MIQASVAREQVRYQLIWLFWLYFILLIGEGALRKWALPSLSDPLLLIRDPVAAAILFFALRDGFLPLEGSMRALEILFVLFVVLGGVQATVADVGSPLVLLYGLRTYFLHPPLVFVMARVFTGRDIHRLLVATLVLAVPIALLMAWQFRSGPLDWINAGAGEGALQIRSVGEKIRPAGPFSFISGPIQYFSMAFACVIASEIGRDRMMPALRWCGWASVLLAASVSGSRSLVAGLVPVLVAAVAGMLVRPRLANGMVRMAATGLAVAMVVWTFSVVQEGVDVLNMRLEQAGTAEMISRSTDTYTYVADAWSSAPLLGMGIGLGTNAAAALLRIPAFQFGETEWTRVLWEAGPVLGFAYLAWRVWLVIELLRWAVRAARTGTVLPLALVGACASTIIIGQWGQATTQGISIWVGGLALASARAACAEASRARRVSVQRHPALRAWEASA